MPDAAADRPAVGVHYRADGAAHAPGVYRVVGVDGESVTLLRVTDAEGRRRSTGRVVTVPWPADALEPAHDPDAGAHPVRWLRNLLSGSLWELRVLTGL